MQLVFFFYFQNVHDEFGQFRQKYEPRIIQLDKDVKDLVKNVSVVDTGLQQIRNTTFGFVMRSSQNIQELNGLKRQVGNRPIGKVRHRSSLGCT